MELKFAFAVNTANRFNKNHFGDADKYLLYEVESNELKLVAEEINIFKQFDEVQEHGSKKKGNAIIEFLNDKSVNVIVSMQFGKNIKMVNQHFIPIILYEESPEQAIEIINKHLHWIYDELRNKKTNYNLFTIKFGVLKSKIE
ncbi:MAG: NifB/NifX family molybdenum-iron cluster-binding protein [Bacteroidota bacterium]|nr:NifB/NifX family molybdenum-iron cluster-binding protein [Bacteroidota bacterium]